MNDFREVTLQTPIRGGVVNLPGIFARPAHLRGTIVFAHGSGSSRFSPRNRLVAHALQDKGFATLLFDLLTEIESADRARVFDIPLLAQRLRSAVRWVRLAQDVAVLPIGLFGASTGAAAALVAAAEDPGDIAAVVSRGGRPDLAGEALARVQAPTLLLVGGEDHVVIELNRAAQAELRGPSELCLIPGATHLFEEPGTLEAVIDKSSDWFLRHLSPREAD